MVAVEMRVSKKHLNMLKKKKGFNMKRSEHDEPSNHMIQIHYKEPKHAKKVYNAITKGRGIRINPTHMSDCMYNGGSIWTKITHGISNVASNPIVKATAPILVQAGTTYATDNPESGALAGQVTNAVLNPSSSGSGLKRGRKLTGKGIMDTIKKVVSDKTTKIL
jgi:hypothetical protein